MKESYIQQKITKYLKDKLGKDIYIFKMPQSQYISRRGIPDLIFTIGGKFYAIEVKTPIGKLTALQSREIELINQAGGIAFTLYGFDKDILDAFIKGLDEHD